MSSPKKQTNQIIKHDTVVRTSDGIRRRAVFKILPKAAPSRPNAINDSAARTEEIALKKKYPEEGIIIQQESELHRQSVADIEADPTENEPAIFSPPSGKINSPDVKKFWRNKNETGTRAKIKNKKFILGAGLATAVILAALLSTVFSRLTLTLKPKVENLLLKDIIISLDASASKIAAAQKTIPVEKMEFPKKVSREFKATGKKFIEERARGRVKIFNSFSSAPQKLVASTRFLTDSGALFRLTATVTIPGAEVSDGKIIPRFAEADLEADQAGEDANMNGQVTMKMPGFKGTPKYDTFYAVASSGFSGGFRGETNVISKEDIDKAQEEATKTAYEELKSDSAKKIPAGLKLLDGLREIQITKVAVPKENTRANAFVVEVEARSRLLVFRESDGIALLKGLILADDSKKKFVDGSADLKYRVQNADFDKGKASIAVEGSIKSQAILSIGEIADIIKGRKEGSINDLLRSRSELADFHASFFPPWISSAPQDTGKIKIINQGE